MAPTDLAVVREIVHECNEKTQVKYYTNNITPKTSEVLWEK